MLLCYHEKAHDNKELSCGNSKPRCESRPVKSTLQSL